MRKFTYVLVLSFLIFSNLHNAVKGNDKYNKWLTHSFFRGYNVLYETPKTLQDFKDFKNYGGNLFQIGTRGFNAEDPPYQTIPENIAGTDLLVNYCRQEGIHYIIAVRSGPGAYDTYLESSGQTGESRIWNTGNTSEQSLYSEMLALIADRYRGDSLFAGLNLVVEPRPKVNLIPANTSQLYKFFLETVYNIHMDNVYSNFVEKVREKDTTLPIIIENFAYSTPELFPSYAINDPYIIYSAHNYMPKEYTNDTIPGSLKYPGTYWNITYLALEHYDKNFIQQTVFGRLKAFQDSIGVPVFLGEFGILYPQIGCRQYLSDVMDNCIENGWHYALWDWRRGEGQQWNVENFTEVGLSSFVEILKRFHAPPPPGQIYPPDSAVVGHSITFTWDSLTAYTTYDILIQMGDVSKIAASELRYPRYTVTGLPIKPGHYYYWQVRSRNPGGLQENISEWSGRRVFIVDTISNDKMKAEKIPITFFLSQNYPNPFNPETKIDYSVPKNGKVKLIVYDVLGREVRTLLDEVKSAGVYKIGFDASSLPSGIYFYRLNVIPADNNFIFSSVKKMVLVK